MGVSRRDPLLSFRGTLDTSMRRKRTTLQVASVLPVFQGIRLFCTFGLADYKLHRQLTLTFPQT